MLWACLLLPALPLDVFARAQSPEAAPRPFAVASGGQAPRIVAANAAAGDAGIVPEQLVSASLALAPDLVLRDRDPAAEAAALAHVATWATQFTPAVSLAPPDAVLAEIGGSLRLFGGLPRLAAGFTRGARDLGYAARLAFAPTADAALLFARAARAAPVTDRSGLERALAPLPLARLDAEPGTIALLAAAGIHTFGQACALPRDALARRVGGGFLATLDRARGRIPDARPPFVPPPRYAGALALPAAVDSVEALAFALNRLVQELAGWLQGRGLGILRLTLSLAHERCAGSRDGTRATIVTFALAAPAREPAHLATVLRERLARVALPAPVVAMTLASEETAPLAGRNLGLLPGDGAAAAFPLLDRLRARLGEDAVTLVVPHTEHRPELAWKTRVRLDFSSRHADAIRRVGKVESDPGFPPRPIWLLAEPEPLGHAIGRQPWVLRDGPERIESGWWDGRDVRRDYFVAESPRGERVWIYRDNRHGDDGEWFVQGVFA
jgi:protein ImuB